MNEFLNKVVVITGGNSGIGEAIASKFSEQGAKIVIFDRTDQKEIGRQHQTLSKSLFIQGDVRNLSDIEKLYKETEQAFGKIDVLVASAGIAGNRVLDEVSEDFFDEIVDINFKGVYFTVQRSVPYLKNGASVILISSVARLAGFRNDSVYSSTKAAVSTLARNFAADLIKRDIRVNAISPGYTDTPIFDKLKMHCPQKIQEFERVIPIGRFADPAEIADAALFLASTKSSYVIGADLIIDGGASAISLL